MRKRIFGRRLKRDTNERKALFRGLMQSLVLHGKIKTTEAKAKAIKGDMEKIVTIARNKGIEAKPQVMSKLVNEKAVDKVFSEIAPLFKNRPGGYTRILRLGNRDKDNAKQVLLTWVEDVSKSPVTEAKRNSVKKDKAEKKAVKKETKVARKSSNK